ncbi:hypothetical protein AVEN_161685-1 [Araneus ventricosus]|uniref:Uncharacterized protein n=1 Tax=Araneus ventricosus TaxID=182803 RepID=A0A4Y2LXC9_ARAVE|nr:hypothetical protein AVEN_161685-1 [Araneus ventricosus]
MPSSARPCQAYFNTTVLFAIYRTSWDTVCAKCLIFHLACDIYRVIQKFLYKFKDKAKYNHIRNLSHHALSWHSGNLNDSYFNNSSTYAGVLLAITGHGLTVSKEVHTVTGGRDSALPHYYTHVQERESTYLSGDFLSTYS